MNNNWVSARRSQDAMLIVPYRDHWPQDFEVIQRVLLQVMPVGHVFIEHVGSTAVPGLAAKPIIDIDVVYDQVELVAAIYDGLDTLGYYHAGDQGIAGREVFKRRDGRSERPVLDAVKHHLYVCHWENEEYQRHILFRDHLRASEALCKAYARLKRQIAEEVHQDRKRYAELKEARAKELIQAVLLGVWPHGYDGA